MGLGNGPDWRDEYEWFTFEQLWAESDAPESPPALEESIWRDPRGRTVGPRVLLVDLDNLRGAPRAWQERMEAVVRLARTADRVYLAGQALATRNGKPHLQEFAKWAVTVPQGHDEADRYLLRAAARIRRESGRVPHFVVASNDYAFARLGEKGIVTVVSPETSLVSKRLVAAAGAVLPLPLTGSSVGRPPRSREAANAAV